MYPPMIFCFPFGAHSVVLWVLATLCLRPCQSNCPEWGQHSFLSCTDTAGTPPSFLLRFPSITYGTMAPACRPGCSEFLNTPSYLPAASPFSPRLSRDRAWRSLSQPRLGFPRPTLLLSAFHRGCHSHFHFLSVSLFTLSSIPYLWLDFEGK